MDNISLAYNLNSYIIRVVIAHFFQSKIRIEHWIMNIGSIILIIDVIVLNV